MQTMQWSEIARQSYAADPNRSRGRFIDEPDDPSRNPFQRDRDRVIHSSAFRRLKHKTQVFVYHEGDHFRTRLTHTIEVAHVARSIARLLGLDEDLAEVLALAHDLGHPPFGHEGENVLDECLKQHGGFDHNAQSFRVVTKLENKYAGFDGLNLTWESLEGLLKHNGPLTDRDSIPIGRYAGKKLPYGMVEFEHFTELMPWSWASAGAQASAIADDIAYNSHDIEDGLNAGLFDVEDMKHLPMVGDIITEVDRAHQGLESHRRIYEISRRVVATFIADVVSESRQRLENLNPQSSDDIRQAGDACVMFSDEMAEAERQLKKFLFENMYWHKDVLCVRKSVSEILRNLFGKYFKNSNEMPDEWQQGLDSGDEFSRARRVADYVAGMTDRFAVQEHERLFSNTPAFY